MAAAAATNAPRAQVYMSTETDELDRNGQVETGVGDEDEEDYDVAPTNIPVLPAPKTYPLDEALRDHRGGAIRGRGCSGRYGLPRQT